MAQRPQCHPDLRPDNVTQEENAKPIGEGAESATANADDSAGSAQGGEDSQNEAESPQA